MKKLFLLCTVLVLCGCPASNQQKIAQAAQSASVVVQSFQQAEIISHNAGAVSDADHKVIQTQLISVAQLGKTTDNCILVATTKQGTIDCVNQALITIDGLYNAGALGIKSADAKEKYEIALLGARTALAVIVTIEGGTVVPASTGSAQ